MKPANPGRRPQTPARPAFSDNVVWLRRPAAADPATAAADQDLLRLAMIRGRVKLARRFDIHDVAPSPETLERLCRAGLMCALPPSDESFVVTAWGAMFCAWRADQPAGARQASA